MHSYSAKGRLPGSGTRPHAPVKLPSSNITTSKKSAVASTKGTRPRKSEVISVASDLGMGGNRIPAPLSYTTTGKYDESHQEVLPPISLLEPPTPPPKPTKKTWDEAELKKLISIKLTETRTRFILHVPGSKVNSYARGQHDTTARRNHRYTELLRERATAKDKFTTNSTQTLNPTLRTREAQTDPLPVASVGVQASAWDIVDAQTSDKHDQHQRSRLNIVALTQTVPVGVSGDPSSMTAQSNASGVSSFTGSSTSTSSRGALASSLGDGTDGSTMATIGSTSSRVGMRSKSYSDRERSAHEAGGSDGMRNEVLGLLPAYQRIARLPSFLNALRVMENAVVQTLVHHPQQMYRYIATGNGNDNNNTNNDPLSPHNASSSSSSSTSQDAWDSPGNNTTNSKRTIQTGSSSSSSSRPGVNDLNPLHRLPTGRVDPNALSSSSTALANPLAHVPVLDSGKQGQTLRGLWAFNSPLISGLPVTSLSWNVQNPDLLAVGYGHTSYASSDPGIVGFWSLANPTHPLRLYRTHRAVTALQFSPDPQQGHLLAVGMHDGSVAVYDVRDPSGRAILESVHPDKHSEAVWTVKWVQALDGKRALKLMTVSSDGTVRQWGMKLGFAPHVLMELKRVPNRAQLDKGETRGSGREASGMALDAPADDPTQYYVGTEEGLVHKCSTSYNEQTLESYVAHTAPVYRVRCSPFLPCIFLSCSADWTCQLWHSKRTTPVLTPFLSGQEYILDVVWAPHNSCVFATVQRSGRVDIWDLTESIEPVLTYRTNTPTAPGQGQGDALNLFNSNPSSTSSLLNTIGTAGKAKTAGPDPTCLAFAPNASVLVVGCTDGSVQVLHLSGMALHPDLTYQQQRERLAAAITKNTDQSIINADGTLSQKHTTAVVAEEEGFNANQNGPSTNASSSSSSSTSSSSSGDAA